jgi:hypothetical protein
MYEAFCKNCANYSPPPKKFVGFPHFLFRAVFMPLASTVTVESCLDQWFLVEGDPPLLSPGDILDYCDWSKGQM